MYENKLTEYENTLYRAEKSQATITKYVGIAQQFLEFVGDREIDKELVMEYKESLIKTHKPAGVNVKIVSVNSFLRFLEKPECCVKTVKLQRRMYSDEKRELEKEDYQKLAEAARGTESYFIMLTIFATGIRASELEFITVEAVRRGEAVINNKGKLRSILLPEQLCAMLEKYISEKNRQSGPVFLNRNGNAYDRTTVWRKVKGLCKGTDVAPEKVFPHNLRHLFARTFYEIEKDIVKLADILGHCSIQTTRIYTLESGRNHRKGMDRVLDAVHKKTE